MKHIELATLLLAVTLSFTLPIRALADPLPPNYTPPALEFDDDVQDTALAATQAGLIKPYSALLAQVEKDFYGRIIEVELDEDDGVWKYKLKLLGEKNNLIKVKYNATTLQVIKMKGCHLKQALKRDIVPLDD
ncbi:MAG: PepSY domain-containing protein [Plesiomonas sp.]|uniref:PepSY domain-containing protein n=1 Tax=Plesiomonas sp. TaxID=2486279 RepID=UPI003F3877DE